MPTTKSEPCSNCPFRRSAKLAHWHPTEYIKLAQMEHVEGAFGQSGLFNCHKGRSLPRAERELCGGWLMDQRRKGVPSMALRLKLMTDGNACDLHNSMTTDTTDVYDSVDELIDANSAADPRIRQLLSNGQ